MTTRTDPTVKTLLRRDWPHRSPSGGQLTARCWGRQFVLLDVDRYFGTFSDEAGAVMRPLADDLAFVAFHARDCTTVISPFGTTGSLYAPVGAADALLAVLVAADRDDVTPALSAAPIIAAHAAPLRASTAPVYRKRLIAREAARRIEVDLGSLPEINPTTSTMENAR